MEIMMALLVVGVYGIWNALKEIKDKLDRH